MRRRIFAGCVLMTSLVYADNVETYLSIGGLMSNPSNTSTVQLTDIVTNNYLNSNNNHLLSPIGGIGIGIGDAHNDGGPFSISLDAAGYYVYWGKISGLEQPFVNQGSFDTLNYSYKIQSGMGMFEPRLFYACENYQPFILLGVGASWNQASGYKENPTNYSLTAARVPEGFTNNTKVSLAYEAGIGAKILLGRDPDVNASYFLSLEYRYINFGTAELGAFPAETTSNGPETTLYANSLLLSLIVTFT